jgi:hypothetical protein
MLRNFLVHQQQANRIILASWLPTISQAAKQSQKSNAFMQLSVAQGRPFFVVEKVAHTGSRKQVPKYLNFLSSGDLCVKSNLARSETPATKRDDASGENKKSFGQARAALGSESCSLGPGAHRPNQATAVRKSRTFAPKQTVGPDCGKSGPLRGPAGPTMVCVALRGKTNDAQQSKPQKHS